MKDIHMNYVFKEEELSAFAQARVGTYFIIPLRTTKEMLSKFQLRKCAENLLQGGWKPYEWKFDDLYQHINDLFQDILQSGDSDSSGDMTSIGIHYDIPVADMMNLATAGAVQTGEEAQYYVITENEQMNSDGKLRFCFRCMQIVIMHTGIGFLIIGIESNSPQTYDLLLHAGYNQNRSRLGIVDLPGQSISFSDIIQTLLSGTGMTDYSGCLIKNQPDSLLRDATTYSVAILPPK